ncbi:MAG: DUF1549 and DUF1553 domain-containing protein [Acidobacteriota bacterium]|nr:DUF1549 and DUF1553 domain-containing protein [Acidobacteriota bacterium]
MKNSILIFGLTLGLTGMWNQARPDELPVSGANCSFTANPDAFLSRESRVRREIWDRASKLNQRFGAAVNNSAAAPQSIPQRNFIDAAIFGVLAKQGIPSAKLSGDEEFLRRITLDLTGRIPASSDIRAFAANTNANKRDTVIEGLLQSPEFVDKWTMWLGDLLQNTSASTNVNRNIGGRDAFHQYLRSAVAGGKSFRDLAWESVTATGNTYDGSVGQSNFVFGATTPMGPIQDTYDTMLSKTATAFLGIAYYDCLLCHNGHGHLDSINLWASAVTRLDAERMAAHFSRLSMPRRTDVNDPVMGSWDVFDRPTGTYDLNTNFGNRPNRVPVGTTKSLMAEYRTGNAPAAGGDWRAAFASQLVADPMFSRNLANRLWKAFFNLGLVDPVDTMDPARLDPKNPPLAPWVLQASNPELLERLSQEMVQRNFQLRDAIRAIVQSSAYQLSSRYSGDWKLEYVPLHARHYPRRMDAEEVHDAIATATGVLGTYQVNGVGSDPIAWAMQLPEPREPLSNGAVANFLNSFLRGNRDNQQRGQSGSILQQLNLMNDNFVLSRVKVAASPELMALSKMTDNNALLDEMFLTFLSRLPTGEERRKGNDYLNQPVPANANAAAIAAARNAAIEDLAWVCINKLDFLYSY